MRRLIQRTFLALLVLAGATSAPAFSLMGPFDAVFQTPAIGYNPFGTDEGGPMALGEGYRWNVKTIYYAFDPSFLHYFGNEGSNAVVQALNVLNNLPPMSKLSSDLHEFPTDTQRINYRAATLGILDLKSLTLAGMMEEMGLAAAERYIWTLRDRRPIAGSPDFQYLVIQRNFDPVTALPTPYVNDTLYYYAIADPIPINPAGQYADAIELPVDPLQSFTTLANAVDGIAGIGLTSGAFYTGLTRDDVGGLRYLYKKSFANSYVENLVTNAIPGSGGGPVWTPAGVTNALVVTAVRPGVDKFQFKLAPNTVFGNFIAFTNQNKDVYYRSNSTKLTSQNYQRAMVLPDIVFAAGDLGLNAGGFPVLATLGPSFANNSALNSQVGSLTAGPGTIQPTTVMTFSKLGPYIINQGPNFLDQANSFIGVVWGSYNGTTNEPVVYGTTIQDLELMFFVP